MKGKAVWWLLKQNGDLPVLLYKNADKRAVRERAAKELHANPKDTYVVAKVSAVTILQESSLKRHLPKDAF